MYPNDKTLDYPVREKVYCEVFYIFAYSPNSRPVSARVETVEMESIGSCRDVWIVDLDLGRHPYSRFCKKVTMRMCPKL